jgi:hypothetical protein
MCVGSVFMIKLNDQNPKALESRDHAKENFLSDPQNAHLQLSEIASNCQLGGTTGSRRLLCLGCKCMHFLLFSLTFGAYTHSNFILGGVDNL